MKLRSSLLTIICTLTFFLLACNPVKRVLNDPEKFEVIKEAVIRSGACVNDTVIFQTSKDSIVYKDSIIEKSIVVPCNDFDTVFANGTSIKVSSGVLYFKQVCPNNEKITTNTITNNIRDTKIEGYLRKDIILKDSAIKAYAGLYEKSQIDLAQAKKENTRLKWKMFLVIAISLAWTFRWTILKLVRPI